MPSAARAPRLHHRAGITSAQMPTLSRFLPAAGLLAVIALLSPLRAQTYDVLIRGGRVLDGTGTPWIAADVAISGDRIVAVGRLPGATAKQVVDAHGLFVAPGFI